MCISCAMANVYVWAKGFFSQLSIQRSKTWKHSFRVCNDFEISVAVPTKNKFLADLLQFSIFLADSVICLKHVNIFNYLCIKPRLHSYLYIYRLYIALYMNLYI